MTNETPRILITAAGGKVGQHVVTQLSAKGVAARAGFHSQDKAAAPQQPGIEGVVLDFENPETIAAAFKGIDKLFLVTPGSPFAARQEERLLAEAKKVGVSRLVKLSGKIAEHHTVGFGVWNTDAERQIKSSGIPYTILRGNFFMQNLFGSAGQIKQGAFTMGPAAKKIALLDTRDVAAVAVAALTEPGHSGQTYDLNGPELLDGHAHTNPNSALYASCAAVHSASARLLLRAQAEGTARADMNGDDLFALMTALGWAVDQPSFAPRANHLVHLITSAILTKRPSSE